MERAKEMVEERLQMPPYMQERLKKTDVLANDPELAPVFTSKYVFVDISQKDYNV